MRRHLKLGLLRLLRALGVFALARRITRHRVRILCYHGVWRGSSRFPGDALFMTAARFREHLDVVRAGGYPVVSLDEAVEGMFGAHDLPPAPVVITIDDGWYSTFVDMWPELRTRGMPATLYVDSGTLLSGHPVPHVMARYVIQEYGGDPRSYGDALARTEPVPGHSTIEERLAAAESLAADLGADPGEIRTSRRFDYMSPEELRAVFAEGLDVQLHTRNHLLPERTAEEVEREVVMNRADLAEVLDRNPGGFRHFCYPSGVHDPAMHEGLRRAGVVSATTTVLGLADGTDDALALPRLILGESHSEIELEAELSGVMSGLRYIRRRLTRS
mgnify:FL=1